AGDVVPVRLERAGKMMDLQLHLETSMATNYRADDFPTVIECAVPFCSHECGGPIVVTRHQVGSRNPGTRFDRSCSSVRVYGPKVTVVQKRKRAAASEPIQPAEGQRQPLWVLRCRRTDARKGKASRLAGPHNLRGIGWKAATNSSMAEG